MRLQSTQTRTVPGSKRAALTALILAGAALASLGQAGAVSAQGQGQNQGPEYVPNEVIIQFRREAGPAHRQDALARAAVRAQEHIFTRPMRDAGSPGLVVAATSRPVPDTIRALRNHPAVAFAEPNWIYRHQEVTSDPHFPWSMWEHHPDSIAYPPDPTYVTANNWATQAEKAWNAGNTGSRDVYVGVIDEGIQYTHPDLSANVWSNPYDPADGIDNDGNGYVDDFRGWDFYSNNNTIYDGTGDDHGTHVTGTLGADGGNGIGVPGVNWKVTYISAKFLGAFGGSTSNAIKSVDYFTDLKKRHGINIVATNNSWGGGGYSQALHEAIIRGAQQNILFVAAAGNGGSDQVGDDNDTTASYPSSYDTSIGTSNYPTGAGYDAVIAVAAIRSDGALATFSNYGATQVDLAAPGDGIQSTVPVDSWAMYSGTSMATPHVTGAAALYAAANPTATAAAIKKAILSTVSPTASLQGKTVTGGCLDVSTFFTPVTAPAPPTNLTAAAGDTQVTLSWTASAGATSYTVYRRTASTDPYVAVSPAGLTGTTYTDTGLTNGTTYYYVVTASNSAGTSAISNEASATPKAMPPAAPTNLTATAGDAQVQLSWTASTGAASYSVYRGTTTGGPYAAVTGGTGITPTSFTDTGLTNGTTYYYVVTASDADGTSGYSNEASATPQSLPAAPTNLAASGGKQKISLTWTQSVTAGVKYNSVYRSETGAEGSFVHIAKSTKPETSFNNIGLPSKKKYWYYVTAWTDVGESPASNIASATTK